MLTLFLLIFTNKHMQLLKSQMKLLKKKKEKHTFFQKEA